MSIEQRIADSGLILPDAPAPLGRYVRGVCRNDLWYLSGQLPLREGEVAYPGRLGVDLSISEGRAAARLAAMNALAQISLLTEGFRRFDGLVRLDGVVACTPDFEDHASVMDGASDLLFETLGERGAHARSVAGVASLPGKAAVELVIVFAGQEPSGKGISNFPVEK